MSKFYRFVNENSKAPELLIYGEIGGWWGDVQAKDFVEKLNRISADKITVRINSDGGDVFTAQAIYSSLKLHPASITVHIDGIAASAATIIAMAGDKIIMPENSMMMIHNPMTPIYGEADELREMAEVLDKVRDTIVAAYRAKTGLDDEKLIELMKAETWMTANEAKDLGFVDEVTEEIKIAAKLKEDSMVVNGLTIDGYMCKTLPKDWINKWKVENKTPTAEPNGDMEVKNMTLEELKEKHPEIYNAAVKAGQEQERERIKLIEALAMPGHDDLVKKAKFDDAITPDVFAIRLIKAEKAVKEGYLQARQKDAQQVQNIQPTASGEELKSEDDKRAAIVNPIAAAFSAKNGHRGGK